MNLNEKMFDLLSERLEVAMEALEKMNYGITAEILKDLRVELKELKLIEVSDTSE